MPADSNALIAPIGRELSRRAVTVMREGEPCDTAANVADLEEPGRDFGFAPATPLAEEIRRFVAWYRDDHRG
jgi:UDP-glucuronate 4-epimerase